LRQPAAVVVVEAVVEAVEVEVEVAGGRLEKTQPQTLRNRWPRWQGLKPGTK